MHKTSSEGSKSWETEIGDFIHMDVGGLLKVNSLGGNRYYLLLRDDHSSCRTVYFMKKKSEVKGNLVHYLTWFENQTHKKVKRLRSDNGRWEVNSNIESLCSQNGKYMKRPVHTHPKKMGQLSVTTVQLLNVPVQCLSVTT